MSGPLRKLTAEIDRRRRGLLNGYDVEDLHQLRVNIRRLRVFLARFDGEAARDLRREWGRLMRFSNDARDWDTFVLFAQEALTSGHFEALYPVLARHQQAGQKLALEVVRSNDWEEHAARWHIFLETAPEFGLSDFETAIGAARKRIGKAWGRAYEQDDQRSWHKLRITIKALRYLLDTHPHAERDHRELIAVCKALQTDLGNWHDTVVHGELLGELIEAGALEDEILHVAEKLSAAQRDTGAQCLARVHETMAEIDITRAR